MKNFIIIIILLTTSFVYSQQEFMTISFEYSNSIKLNSAVDINIYPSYKSQDSMLVVSENKNIKKEISISNKKFKEIVINLLKIKPQKMVNNFKEGLDGSHTKISFGDYYNTISYTIWGLSKAGNKNGLKYFLNAAILILESAGIKINEINGK